MICFDLNEMDSDSLASDISDDRSLVAAVRQRMEATPSEQRWMTKYRDLEAIPQQMKAGNIPHYMRDETSLALGIKNLRDKNRNDELHAHRSILLQTLEHDWKKIRREKEEEVKDLEGSSSSLDDGSDNDIEDQLWMNEYKKIQAIHQAHGRILCDNEGEKLNIWIADQRLLRYEKQLRPYREQLLDELGMVWIRVEDEDDTETWGKIQHNYYGEDFERMAEANVLALECEENLWSNLNFAYADVDDEEDGTRASAWGHCHDGNGLDVEHYKLETEQVKYLDGSENSANSKENGNGPEKMASHSNASDNGMAKAVSTQRVHLFRKRQCRRNERKKHPFV